MQVDCVVGFALLLCSTMTATTRGSRFFPVTCFSHPGFGLHFAQESRLKRVDVVARSNGTHQVMWLKVLVDPSVADIGKAEARRDR